MAIDLRPNRKPYTARSDAGGVPATELESIVGERIERAAYNADTGFVRNANVSFALNYKPPATATQLRIRILDGNTQLYNGRVDPLSILGVVAASPGDTLVQDGTNTQTGYLVTRDSGSIVLFAGRQASNILLLQSDTQFAATAIIQIIETVFDGGIISERIQRIDAQPSHQVILHQLSSSRPADPLATAIYDGTDVTGAGGGWVDERIFLAGSGTEWTAFAAANFNPLAGRYIIGEWTVLSNADGVHVQYSADGSSWHNTRDEQNDLYIRYRNQSGEWVMEDIFQHTDGWQIIASIVWGTDGAGYDKTSRAIASTDLREWKNFLIEFSWSSFSGQSAYVIVPSAAVQLASPDQDFGRNTTRLVWLRRSGTGASYDDPAFLGASSSDVSGNVIAVAWQLEYVGAGTGDNLHRAQVLRIDPVNTSLSGTLRFYRGR